MLKHILPDIHTSLILYVEHDAPLLIDRMIEWDKIKKYIFEGHADLVRFLHEEEVHSEHKHLVFGEDKVNGFVQTMQWSQRPHLTTKVFYERILANHFGEEGEFIEDVMHGVVQDTCGRDKRIGWYQFRLCIYKPDDPVGIKRSYHLDGRKTI